MNPILRTAKELRVVRYNAYHLNFKCRDYVLFAIDFFYVTTGILGFSAKY